MSYRKLLLTLCVLVACALDDVTASLGEQAIAEPLDIPAASTPPLLRECVGRAFAPTYSGGWEHKRSRFIVLSAAGHSVEDLIITLGASSATVEGKFAYGSISKDLEDEHVQAFVDDCAGWLDLGTEKTDSDGRVRFTIPASILDKPGRYEVRMVVQGDGTQTYGYLLVTPAGTQFVVFDIDGTLTTSDFELIRQYFSELFGRRRVPTAYDGAQDVVQAYRDAGYEVLYMTGRPYWLSDITREWLVDQKMPLGNLRLTRRNSESLPTDGGVGAYKRDYLQRVMADHAIARAYGNATTDIFAYTSAPLPLAEVFIIGPHAGEDGTQAVSDYPTHLGLVRILRTAQPFRR
jgi:phosphatidate phosphatase PAH1